MKKLILPLVAMAALAGGTYYYLSLPKQAPIARNDNVQTTYSPALALGQTDYGSLFAQQDRFGQAVALRGHLLLVGAEAADHEYKNIDQAGLAYLIDTRNGELIHTFAMPESVDETDPTERMHAGRANHYPRFGSAVAMNDKYALIGAPSAAQTDGAAYLFDIETGDFVHRFSNPDMIHAGWFGANIALSETQALIAVGNLHNRVMYEQAFLFDLERPDQVVRLATAQSDPALAEISSVALNGRYAVLARSHEIAIDTYQYGVFTTKVQVFDTCTGQLRQTIAPDNWYESSYSVDIALHNDDLLIGSPNQFTASRLSDRGVSTKGFNPNGVAHLYSLLDGERLAEFRPQETENGNRFGLGVALNGTHAVVQQNDQVVAFDRETKAAVFAEVVGDSRSYEPFGLAMSDTGFAIGVPDDAYQAVEAGVVFLASLNMDAETTDDTYELDLSKCRANFMQNAESARRAAEMTLAAYSAISAYGSGDMSFDEASELAEKAGFNQLRWNLAVERSEMSDTQRAIQGLDEIRDALNGL